MYIKSEESITQTQQSDNKLASWSIGLSLFSLFGNYVMIFAFVPFFAVLYLFLHTTPSDFISIPAIIFIKMIQFITVASGLAAIVTGILALSRMNGTRNGKAFAVLGILIGFVALFYHAYIMVW